MWIVGIAALAIVAFAFSHGARASSYPRSFGGKSMSNARGYSTQSWVPIITAYAIPAGIPWQFAVAWEGEESNGNPCAIGAPGAIGPDGNPREMGIGQLYNPDDFHDLGRNPSDYRAYCNPNKVQVMYRGKMIWSHSQEVIRDLTETEVQQQASDLIHKISRARNSAFRSYQAAHLSWPTTGKDFWRLVKMIHGLPGLVQSLPSVTAHLGRPPTGWNEFRSTIIDDGLLTDSETEKYRGDFPAIFDNAEKATSTMGGEANV